MISEEQEIEQVHIAHRGACPLPKGHADHRFSDGLFLGLFVGAILIWVLFYILSVHYDNEMIEHGAGYWGNDQQWIWRQ